MSHSVTAKQQWSIKGLIKRPEIAIFAYLLVFRLGIFLIGMLLFIILNTPPTATFWGTAQDTWYKWDTRHYIEVAEQGYSMEGDSKYRLVLFPLYPVMIGATANTFGLPTFYAGLLVSWLAFAGAGVLLYSLVKLEFDTATARRAVTYLALFPFTFFFGMAYTESLFLFFLVGTFLALRKQHWHWAALALFLASLTRLQGILLVLPALIELHLYWKSLPLHRRQAKRVWHIASGFEMAAAGGAGVGIFLLINQVVSGNWLQFLIYQREHWLSEFTPIYLAIPAHFAALTGEQNILMTFGTWLPQLVLFFLTLLLIVAGYFLKVRISYLSHWLLHLIISYSTAWLLCGTRYMLPVFTLYIVLALLARKKSIDLVLMILLTIGLIISLLLYLQNAVL
jgi:Gpi18-like mannosyltransferase